MKKTLAILSLIMFILCGLSYAAVPHLINYQGRLTDSNNTPLNGSYDLTFRIYDAETSGNLLWEETQTGIVIQKGIFSILLGSVKNLNLTFDKPYFLEIKVGEEIMSPRQRISSVGYAIRAEAVDYADKIKADSSDPAPGYLSDKVDNKTIKIDNATHKIYVAEKTGYQVFTSSGTFFKPDGVDKVTVEVVGGGGGGKGCYDSYPGSGGGGGGGYAKKICTLTGNVTVTVGLGGQGGMNGDNGTAGGNSSFGSFCTAKGGAGGSTTGGAGGIATGGDINISGGNGGGESAGGGNGGNSIYGFGGSKISIVSNGQAASGYGGGGGGASVPTGGSYNKFGGNGTPGIVIVKW